MKTPLTPPLSPTHLTPYTPTSLHTLRCGNPVQLFYQTIKSVLSTPKNKQSSRTKRSRRTLTKRWVERTSSFLLSTPPPPHPHPNPHCCKSPAAALVFSHGSQPNDSRMFVSFCYFHFNFTICSICFCLDQAMSENGGEENMVGRSR